MWARSGGTAASRSRTCRLVALKAPVTARRHRCCTPYVYTVFEGNIYSSSRWFKSSTVGGSSRWFKRVVQTAGLSGWFKQVVRIITVGGSSLGLNKWLKDQWGLSTQVLQAGGSSNWVSGSSRWLK